MKSLKYYLVEKEFSEEEREKLADSGKAMPDGSYPIENEEDLKNAIQSVGRAKDYDKSKKWIIKRAGELNKTDLLPDDWGVNEASGYDVDANEYISVKGKKNDVKKAVRILNNDFSLTPDTMTDEYTDDKGVFKQDFDISGDGYLDFQDAMSKIKNAKPKNVDIEVSIQNETDEY